MRPGQKPGMFPDEILTARLRLRPLEEGDAPAIFDAYAGDPEVARVMTWRPHRDVGETRAYVASCRAPAPEAARVYAIVGRDDGVLRGALHLRRPAPHRVEAGYVLARTFWGCGLATGALRAAVDRMLAEPGVFRVGAVCDVDNPASARVVEKAEFAREGVLKRWMIHTNLSDEPRDCLSYARVR